MNDKKRTPREPVQEERRALEDYTTKELVEEFRKRDDGYTMIMGENGTFKNVWDQPIRVFIVPEDGCTIIKPRLRAQIWRYAFSHDLPWKIFCITIFLELVLVIVAIAKIVSIT